MFTVLLVYEWLDVIWRLVAFRRTGSPTSGIIYLIWRLNRCRRLLLLAVPMLNAAPCDVIYFSDWMSYCYGSL